VPNLKINSPIQPAEAKTGILCGVPVLARGDSKQFFQMGITAAGPQKEETDKGMHLC